MSRNRMVLDTPVGKIRTVTVNNARYYLNKDVCVGLGLTGHSPWSWHATEAGNKQRTTCSASAPRPARAGTTPPPSSPTRD